MQLSRLAQGIAALAPHQGFFLTCEDALRVYRYEAPVSRTYATYSPSLCLIASGEKRAMFGSRTFEYQPGSCLVVGLPRAAEMEAPRASVDDPVLGLVLDLDMGEVGQVALEIVEAGGRIPPPKGAPEGLPIAVDLHPPLLEAVALLLDHAGDPVRQRLLSRGALRQILFHLLLGPSGGDVQRLASQTARSRPIVTSVRFIEQHFREELRVPDLARRAGMSESLYYQKFRAALGMTPLQYLKRVRLQSARILMLNGGGVAEVAFQVGYGSPSHFSRDFRELYGHAPSALGPGLAISEVEVERRSSGG